MNSLQNQIILYNKAFSQLIHEKDGFNKEEKNRKIAQLAKDLFIVEGDVNFQNKIAQFIKNVSEVKPGRKLISALSKYGKKITVKPGFDYRHCALNVIVGTNEKCHYSTFSEGKLFSAEKPLWVDFAHELVHALHCCQSREDKSDKVRKNILADMDSLEEQHTICGFNPEILLSTKSFELTDILCENAFLIAAHLPHRIHHRGGHDFVDTYETKDDKLLESNYYLWLESALTRLNVVPKEKNNDQEFILKSLKDNPIFIKFISDELKNDKKFILKALDVELEILDHVPELCKDSQFMLEAYQVKAMSAEFIDHTLYSNKEFVLAALKIFRGRFKGSLISKIDPSLKNDIEIQSLII